MYSGENHTNQPPRLCGILTNSAETHKNAKKKFFDSSDQRGFFSCVRLNKMLNIEELPSEIQLMIWTNARLSAKDWENDLEDMPLHRWESYTELLRMDRKQRKTLDYILYMKRVKEFELGLRKKKPHPHYLPTCRKCKSCGDLTIPKSEPSWKTQCIECFKHTKHPWKYGFR